MIPDGARNLTRSCRYRRYVARGRNPKPWWSDPWTAARRGDRC